MAAAEALLECLEWAFRRNFLTDRGIQLMSDVMREVNRLLSIESLPTIPYDAQCKGLVERFDGTSKSMLKRLSGPSTPAESVSARREVPQESLGFSPFELLFGRRVMCPLAVIRRAWTDEEKLRRKSKRRPGT